MTSTSPRPLLWERLQSRCFSLLQTVAFITKKGAPMTGAPFSLGPDLQAPELQRRDGHHLGMPLYITDSDCGRIA